MLLLSACPVMAVDVGMTVEELIAAEGEPNGKMGGGGRTVYFYDGGGVTVENGVVVEVEIGFRAREQKREKRRSFEARQRDKGLVKHNGQWMRPAKRDKARRAERLRNASGSSAAPAGQRVNLSSLLVRDRVTVIDFYADWCGPCKRISPLLLSLVRQYEDVELKKVDIQKWGSPVAEQFDIDSIPDIRVYDRRGRQIGRATHDLRKVKRYIEKAR